MVEHRQILLLLFMRSFRTSLLVGGFGVEDQKNGLREVPILRQGVFGQTVHCDVSGLGGLVVSILASGTQDRGFKPGRNRRIFRAKKSSACLPSEGK
jgi:hypothetical protein